MIEDTSEFAGVVYGLHLGDFKFRYIGQTRKTMRSRMADHRCEAKRGTNRPLYDWMRKHGIANVQVCVIETFSDEDMDQIDEREIFHIAQARFLYFEKNLNLDDGGKARVGYFHSPETKAKISAACMGNKNTLGSKHSPEHQAKLAGAKVLGNHKRWHINRGIVKPECSLCQELV